MKESSLEQVIRHEQNKQLLQAFPVAALVATALAFFLAYFASKDVSTEWVVTWLAVFLATMCYRVFVFLRFNNIDSEAWRKPEFRRHFMIGALTLGICWMLAVVVFLPQMSLINQALSNILFAGVAAGAVSSLSYVFFIAAFYVSLILLPLAIVMGLTDSGLASVSFMAVLFLVSLIVMSRRFGDAFRHNVKMRYEADIANINQQQSDRRLGLLFEGSPLAILEWNADLNISDWNPSAESIFGYSKDEAISMPLSKIFVQHYDGLKRLSYDLLLQEKSEKKYFECIDKFGKKIITEWFSTKVVLDDQVQETKFAAQIVDISEFELTKKEVLEKELRYEHMLEHFPVVLYCCETSGDFAATYISSNVNELFGYLPSQFLDDAGFWVNNIHPDDKERVFRDLVKLFEFGKYAHEYRFKMPDGQYVWVRDELTLVRDEQGHPVEIIGSWTNCEETKQAYLTLERFKQTLDMTLDCVFIFDAENLFFTYVNKGATDQVGYTETELKRMHVYDIKPEYDEQAFRKLIQPLLNKELKQLNFETLHVHRDGDVIPVEIFLQYIEIPDEHPRFVAIVRDITERRRVEKMKEEFVSTVSHELRTPLTSVFGAIGLMKNELENNHECSKEISRFVDIAYKNSIRLSTLITDIIDMEKMTNGVLGVYLKPCLVLPLIKESIEENTGFAQQYDVRYRLLETPLDNCIVHIDSSRFLQVMTNLLSNAAKYTRQGDEVLISLTAHYDNIRISVTDHGRGIPENVSGRIFERFVQADSSDTRIGGGSGLGLSICKYLVEKMNGKIGYFPNARGEGTTFFVDLPKE